MIKRRTYDPRALTRKIPDITKEYVELQRLRLKVEKAELEQRRAENLISAANQKDPEH